MLVATSLLVVPLIAQLADAGVDWHLFDYLVMGVLLAAAGYVMGTTWRRVRSGPARWIMLAGVVAAFLLVWAELAVGIFGGPLAGS